MRILIPPGNSCDGSAYLGEILHAFGLCFAERCSLTDALKSADPSRDVILLPAASQQTGVESFLQAGGGVVAIQPGQSLERLVGLLRIGERQGPSRLRWTQPICHAAQGQPLWTLGPIVRYANPPAPNVAGYLFHPGEADSESPGIMEIAIGPGRLAIYAYDPVACIARLRQGHPERAGFLPPGQIKPRSLYLHEPNPPPDTLWRPTADLHCMALCEIIRRLLNRHAPVPSLWHIPDGSPSILLFSGDEDGGTQEANDRQMRDLESASGAMNLYVLPEYSSITPELIDEFTRRGHAISVHPNLTPSIEKPLAEQIARAEQQVRLFQDTFKRPVRTVRNHNYSWPGYLDIPELWQRLGIGLDANTCAFLYRQSPDGGPYANVHSAMPLCFVRPDGSLIDVYQQATHVNDDLWFHPTVAHSLKISVEQFDWIACRILDDAVRYFHGPICANFHPCNYVDFSGEQGRMLMRRARERDLSIWSLDRWHDWWRARASWRMTRHEWDGTRLRLLLMGKACESLYITLPAVFAGRAIQKLSLAGLDVPCATIERHGRCVVHAALPAGLSQVEAIADYGAAIPFKENMT